MSWVFRPLTSRLPVDFSSFGRLSDVVDLCGVEGCGRKRSGHRLLCERCYRQQYRKTAAPCSVEGCGKPAVAHGWCAAHHSRWRRFGTPLEARPVKVLRDTCGVEGCDRKHFGRGFCQRHYRAAFPEKANQPWNDRRRANYQMRKARKKGTLASDKILFAEIRVRDGNRCGLCGKRVGSKPWPHPLSASLDHILPLSKGGAHVAANVQLAHLRCNLEKGNRARGERLRLVG